MPGEDAVSLANSAISIAEQALARVAALEGQLAIDEMVNADEAFFEKFEQPEGVEWSGEVFYLGTRFYDAVFAGGDTTGTAITDNSTGKSKTWIKVDFSSNAVSYEDGPPPYVSGNLPQDEEWYETKKHAEPIHIVGR